MAKSTPIQTNFSGGELGPLVEGRVDAEKHATGLEFVQNYIPTLEGPLVRTPGTKRVTSVKDPSKPGRLIPFKISNDDQYLIEMGENYMRFFTKEGQAITSGTSYIGRGILSMTHLYPLGTGALTLLASPTQAQAPYFTSRSTNVLKSLELTNGITNNYNVFSSVASGTILEIPTPYDYNMVQSLGYSQKGDTLWLTHSSIPTFTLQKIGPQDWDLKYFHTKDGPYLPLNSYRADGDYANKKFYIDWDNTVDHAKLGDKSKYSIRLIAHSAVVITNVIANGSSAEVWTKASHGLDDKERVWVTGVAGTSEINNGSSSTGNFSFNPNSQESSVWTINVLTSTSFLLVNSVFSNAYVGSGIVYPAIFSAQDSGRNIGFYTGGKRYYGIMQTGSNVVTPAGIIPHPIRCDVSLDPENDPLPVASTVINVWQMGAHNRYNGWPSAGAFHQGRLFLAGVPGRPTEFNASRNNDYTSFSANNASSLTVTDTNALQFNLISDSNDLLRWIKPSVQGVYFASNNAEFLVSPSKDGQALTPTNINNDIIGNYGSAQINPTRFGDSVIYLQNSQRKVRELRFFANLQSHKSTQINQISDHIGLPQIQGLAAQKETYPLVWGYRSDGKLISMSYARDDSQAITGWATHELGGRSDSAGTAPKVKSIEVMKDATGKYDQLWMTVQRYINGTSDVVVEYMVEPYRHRDISQKQRDAYYVSCGATYDSSIVISNITTGSALITATAHGFARNDLVLISDVVGLNSSLMNINGVQVGSNIVNDRVFVVGSTTTNDFFLQDFNSSIIQTATYSPYFSGGKARKLVSSVGGLTWLKNEEVDVLGDGGIQGKITVASSGVLTLRNPAAVVQIGYAYKSRLKTLTKDSGSRTGSAIGQMQKTYQIAVKVKDIGDLSYSGIDFNNLHSANFAEGDLQMTDAATPLYTGIFRDGLEADVGYYGQVYLEQSSPLPGMIQSITYLMDEVDT